MEDDPIPSLVFRIEPGYTFQQELVAPCLQPDNKDDILIGQLTIGSKPEAVFLGKVAEYGRSRNVWLDCEGAHAVYVMGKRRSGKTYTLGTIMEGLASENWIRQGGSKQAILVLDTMNVFVTAPHTAEDVYGERSKEVEESRRWGLKSEKLNIVLFYPKGTPPPLEGKSREISVRPADLDDKDWAALFGLDTYGDPMGQLIADIYEKVVLEGYKDVNGKRINNKQDYSIDDLLNCLDNCAEIQNGYHQDTLRAVRARLKAIKRQGIFSETGAAIEEVFLPGQISILLLRDIEQNLRSLLVGILVKRIMHLRSVADRYERSAIAQKGLFESFKEKGDKEKVEEAYGKYQQYQEEAKKGLPRGWIIIDEAHNYMPAKGITPSGKPLRKCVDEGRNLGLSIVMATQNPSALDRSIRRNADILIIHSISMRDDITAAEGMVNTFLPDTFEFGKETISSRVFEQLVRSLNPGYAVISNDGISRVLVAKIRPRITVHGGIEY